MAFPSVIFSEEGRVKTAKILGVIHWINIVPAFLCLITALYIQFVISDQVTFIENYNGHALPGFLLFTGFFGFFGHILCGKVFWANNKAEKREKWAKFLLPAVVVTIFIFLFELIGGIVCIVHAGELEESLTAGILTSLNGYSNDLTLKEEIDTLQIEYECCGSKSYQDWFKVAWIHTDFMSKQAKLQNSEISDDVPFSCCSPHVLRPCINHHVLDNSKHYNYDYRVQTTLYTKGCAEKLMDFYENTLLSNGGAIILGLSFIQLILAVACRIFQTAILGSMDSDDKDGESVGFLFGEVGGGDKDTDLDTTVETADTEATEDQTLDTSLETEETYEEPPSFEEPEAEETAYLPMNSTTRPSQEVIYENTRPSREVIYGTIRPSREVIYENTRPYPDDEEHIYHDEEVEQYLLSKFNNSKHYFETISSEPSPVEGGIQDAPDAEELNDYLSNKFNQSKHYFETVSSEPSPVVDKRSSVIADVGFAATVSGGLASRSNSRSPSKSSMKKRSSTYVGFDPSRVRSEQEPIYDNLMTDYYTGPSVHYDVPGTINNSNIVASNMSRNHSMQRQLQNGQNAPFMCTRILRSPDPELKLSHVGNILKSRSKSYSKQNSLSARTQPRATSLSKTKRMNYGSLRKRIGSNKEKDRHEGNPFIKLRSKSADLNRPRGSIVEIDMKRKQNLTGPFIGKTVRPVYPNKVNTSENLGIYSATEPVKESHQVFQRVQIGEKSGKRNSIGKSKQTMLNEETKKSKTDQAKERNTIVQNILSRSDIQEIRVQPEKFFTSDYKPDVIRGNIQNQRYGSTNVRTSNLDFPEITQDCQTVYQTKDSTKFASAVQISEANRRSSGSEHRRNKDRKSMLGPLTHKYVQTEERIKPMKGVFYAADNNGPGVEVDDTGIVIDRFENCDRVTANKTSNSVNIDLSRSQSLSPIFPVKSLEPLSPRKPSDDDSDSETIVINLVPDSESDTSTLKAENLEP